MLQVFGDQDRGTQGMASHKRVKDPQDMTGA